MSSEVCGATLTQTLTQTLTEERSAHPTVHSADEIKPDEKSEAWINDLRFGSAGSAHVHAVDSGACGSNQLAVNRVDEKIDSVRDAALARALHQQLNEIPNGTGKGDVISANSGYSIGIDMAQSLRPEHCLKGYALDVNHFSGGGQSDKIVTRLMRRIYTSTSRMDGILCMLCLFSAMCLMGVILALIVNECLEFRRCLTLWVGLIVVLVVGATLVYCTFYGFAYPGWCNRLPRCARERLLPLDDDARSTVFAPRIPTDDIPCCPKTCPQFYRVYLLPSLSVAT